LLSFLLLLGLFVTGLYNYLLFHTLIEMFAVAVTCGIFMISWNCRRFMDNDYLLLLGIAYLFTVSTDLDLINTVAYQRE